MKEFDIEDLKRENVYRAPEGFFDDMQRNVLQQTIPQKKGRIVKLNWAYSAAAAIAVILGLTIFINSEQTQEQEILVSNTARKIAPTPSSEAVNRPAVYENNKAGKTNVDLTSEPIAYQNKTAQQKVIYKPEPTKLVRKIENVKASNPELQVDQILATFTSADLADVGKNTEQDIYLDLYN